MERGQSTLIRKDLDKKIVFLVGPRQVGKTWLAREIGNTLAHTTYLSWDRFEDRQIIQTESWPRETELLILDELHKMENWKNFLKGIFDTRLPHLRILVTGSARLDAFRSAGDSLAGRFFVHRLLPFSLAELRGQTPAFSLSRFLARGGFPEPFLAVEDGDANRWRQHYFDGLIQTDLLNLETIHNLKALRTLIELLRRGVGSPLSVANLARDINVSAVTAARYIDLLEALYLIFKIHPFSNNIARSLLKSPKIYFFDTGLVEGGDGPRFENQVALSLLKHCWYLRDAKGEDLELHYLRDKQGHEVDFCLVRKEMVELAIEAKWRDRTPAPALGYFCEKYNFNGVQVVGELKRERSLGKIEIRDAEGFLGKLAV